MFEDSCTMLHERNGVKFANKKYPREQVPRWIILDLNARVCSQKALTACFQPDWKSLVHTKAPRIYIANWRSIWFIICRSRKHPITKCGNLVFFCWNHFRGIPPHVTNHVNLSPRVLAFRSRKALSRWISIATAHRRWSKSVGFWRGDDDSVGVGFWLVFPIKKPLDMAQCMVPGLIHTYHVVL